MGVELLEVSVTYSEPGRKMSASGTIDALRVELSAERPRFRSRTTVTGTIAGKELELEIDADSTTGTWGGQPAGFELIKSQDNLLADGWLLGEKVEVLLTARFGFRFTAMNEEPRIDLLVDGDQPRLTLGGEVERVVDAAVLAVLVPTLTATTSGFSVGPYRGPGPGGLGIGRW